LSVLDKVRRWIDGETAELVLEEAARNAQVKPRSKAEEFIVKIARAVEEVMQREMVPLPQGTTIIPTEYAIFLSDSDDKDWQGIKRKGLEQGLYHILAERAREIAGKKKLETKSFVLELRVDGTLEAGEVRVQHSWEDSSNNKTGVLVRPKGAASGQLKYSPPAQQQPTPPSDLFVAPGRAPGVAQQPAAGPAPQTTQEANISDAVAIPPEDAEEMTNVRPRVAELYKLEIWRGGIRQNVVPIFASEVVVGRGSRSKPVDIALAGDAEVSRRHLVISADGRGGFWVTNEGRNPAMINNYELPTGKKVALPPGTNLSVCSYVLRIQR
jgi:hypothetical protein